MNLPASDRPPLWQRRWFGPALVAPAAVAMLVWTWQTWPDVLVDFGVQLYVPWRLTQGQVLYRDIAHYTGPLSVYYNALAFWLFGASLRVLEIANLPILAATIALIYWLALRLGGRMCATICGLSFVALFAFAHLTPSGNYNYVCPYEYEYTHALLLCLACISLVWRFAQGRRLIDLALAGLLTGMVFLTRAEFFVAIVGAAAVGLTLTIVDDRRSIRAVPVFLGMLVLPAAVSFILLWLAMPAGLALHGTLGMWPALLQRHITDQHFYQHSMGLDDLPRSLRLLGLWCCAYMLPLAAAVLWAILARRRQTPPNCIAAAALGLLLIGSVWRGVGENWLSAFRPLPVVCALALVVALVRMIRCQGLSRRIAGLALMLAIFSLLLLPKIFFYARVVHYGCWLAMPATMVLLIVVFGWIPEYLRRIGANAPVFVAGAAGLWCAIVIVHLAFTAAACRQLSVTVGTGADSFRADSRGAYVSRATDMVEQLVPTDKTLACFPEGIMINYLARRRAPTPYVNFNPPDLLLFGEATMLQSLEHRPPDYILIVHKQTSEFGVRFFGWDYGRAIYQWIAQNYREQPVPIDLGAPPLRDNRFGIRLMIPRAQIAASPPPPPSQ
jgi:4-amino-4-deoxy-L-arabinose transferase-like glycosyltransferase